MPIKYIETNRDKKVKTTIPKYFHFLDECTEIHPILASVTFTVNMPTAMLATVTKFVDDAAFLASHLDHAKFNFYQIFTFYLFISL